MGHRPTFSRFSSGAQITTELLGESYKVVKTVRDNLDTINGVAENLETLQEVGETLETLPASVALIEAKTSEVTTLALAATMAKTGSEEARNAAVLARIGIEDIKTDVEALALAAAASKANAEAIAEDVHLALLEANGDIAGSIDASPEKLAPVSMDLLGLVDSEDEDTLKKFSISSLLSTVWAGFSSFIASREPKTTLHDNDVFTVIDSEADNAPKTFSWAAIKTAMADALGTVGGGEGSEGHTHPFGDITHRMPTITADLAGLNTKANPKGTDRFLLADSEESNAAKAVTMSDLSDKVEGNLGYVTGLDQTGTTDCAAKINAAIIAAEDAGVRVLHLPAGDLRINNPIYLRRNVLLKGTGRGTHLRVYAGNCFVVDANNAPLIRSGVEDMRIFNMGTLTDTSKTVFKLDACQFCIFKGLDIIGYHGGTIFLIQPLITVNWDHVAIHGRDYHNFVFNKVDHIWIDRCRIGFRIRGGASATGAVTNVVTHNTYSDVIIREVTEIGIDCGWYHDNDRFYNVFINLVQNGAVGVFLSSGHPTAAVGVSAHHFYSLTLVRQAQTYTELYGIALKNSPQHLFIGLAGDFDWPVDNSFIHNPLGVEVWVLASFFQPPVGSSTYPWEKNRIGLIDQTTLTKRHGIAYAAPGVTSVQVTFDSPMYGAPGLVNAVPMQDVGVRHYIDGHSITKYGFTIRFSNPTARECNMNWFAECRVV